MHRIYTTAIFVWVTHRLLFHRTGYLAFSSTNGKSYHWMLFLYLGMCSRTLGWIPWKIQNVTLIKKKKKDLELFWTNSFKQGVKLHQGNRFGDQQGEEMNLISLCRFAYIFLADIFGDLFYDNGSVIVTFLLFTSSGLLLSGLQERPATTLRGLQHITVLQSTINTVQDTFSPEYLKDLFWGLTSHV